MKKLIYILIALMVLGGVGFVLTQTGLLKGELEQILGIKTQEMVEVQEVTDPATLEDPNEDTDGDNLTNKAEIELGTDPENPDTDGDGLPDGLEEKTLGTDPLDEDTDDGTVSDGDEVTAGTNPLDDSDDISESEEATYACMELNIIPDTYTFTVEGEDVEFAVRVDLEKETMSFIPEMWTRLLQAFTLTEINLPWEGTLVVETTGSGTLTDSSGNSGSSLEVSLSYYATTEDFTYTDGAGDDEIRAYIKEEMDCEDKLILAAPEEEKTEELACTDLAIDPDSYTLSTDETEMDFTVTVESEHSDEPAWTFLSNLMAFTIIEEENVWEGMLIIETDSTSSDVILANDQNSNTGSSIKVAVRGSSTEVAVTYSGAADGDTLTATILDEEDACTDTLTLDQEEAVEDTTTTTTDDEDDSSDDDTTASATTTDDAEEEEAEEVLDSTTVASSDWDTIFTSKEYVCSEPFGDTEEEDWFWGNVCRMYQGDVVDGRDYNSFEPGDNMTKAEAIKVLMLLSGHDLDDADGKTEGFRDVSSTDWYYPYMVIAQDEDVARVRDGELFYPNSNITRGQFMLFMVRTANQTLYGWDEDDIPFSDIDDNDPYTYAILIGYETWVEDPDEGLTRVFEGYSDGTSGATEPIERSEAMALALRFYLAWYAD